MGKRGPKRTPTPILKLRGSWLAKDRTQGENLPQQPPECPKRLSTKRPTPDGEFVRKQALAVWDRLAPQLYEAGLLVDAYSEALEMLCDSWARYLLACRKCDEEGMVAGMIQRPWLIIRNRMWQQVYKGAACFGLTPADIAGVRATEKPTVQDDEKKFFGGTA